MKHIKRYFPLLIIITLSTTAWGLGLHHYLNFDMLRSHHHQLETYVSLQPLLSISLFMAVYILIVAISLPGATFMTLLGGLLFGQMIGTVSSVISATIGATILFVSARLASEDLLTRKAGPWIDKMKRGFQENAFYYLLTLRLIPIFPFVAINLVAAIFQVSLKTFLITTLIGIIPGSFVYVSLGSALKDVIVSTDLSPKIVLEPKFIIAFAGLGVLSLLPVLYKRFHRG